MGSRLRENVLHLFECFCEVVRPQGNVSEAWIIQKFPEHYKDEEVLKSVPKFAYPCDFDNSVIQHYSFVLTSADSKWTFGFCRHDPKSETALVLLSYLPLHEIFYKLLNTVSDIIHSSKNDTLYPFLNKIYTSRVPHPGDTIKIPLTNESTSKPTLKDFEHKVPLLFQLPSIPENRNLTEYYNAVDCDNMIRIFASMLFERRIVFTSKRLNRLSACVQAANAVIYPMNWQHIFIPVLPKSLIDYLLAPMPYLIGVPEPLLHNVRSADVGEVVILNADSNTVETPFDDYGSLPPEVIKQLKTQLKQAGGHLGDGVSRAFLRALVQLIGGYREALVFKPNERITFDGNLFVEARPLSMQPFLRKMLHLQIFQQFIDERLNLLNEGCGFTDEFEREVCCSFSKSSPSLKAQYKEWTHAMKKEGSAFFKSVKTRANPTVKSAVKTVKERGKDVGKACKGIKSRFKDLGEEKSSRGRLGGGSITPTTPSASYHKDILYKQRRSTGSDLGSGTPYTSLMPTSPETDDAVLPFPSLNLDLMGDMEAVLKAKCSLFDSSSLAVPRNMKPVRSLEDFKCESGSSSVLVAEGGPAPATSDDSVFLLTSLPNPETSRPTPTRRTNKERVSSSSETEDLIRLDSTPSDDFDPLENGDVGRRSLANPLYHMYEDSMYSLDLLKELGLDFNGTPSSGPNRTQHWTTFDN